MGVFMSERDSLFESIKAALLATQDELELSELIGQHAFILEDDFLSAAERWQSEAQAAGQHDVAEALGERLEVLRELARQDLPEIQATLSAFAEVQSFEEMEALAAQRPMVLESAFHDIVTQIIDHAKQMGEDDDASALSMRLSDVREIASRQKRGNNDRLAQLVLELPDQQSLLELAQRTPDILEEAFISDIEQRLVQAEAQEDRELTGRLRARLEGLRHVQAQVQIALPQTLEAFASTRDPGEILALGQRAPYIFEERFTAAVEQAIAELEHIGAREPADGLRMRLTALQLLAEQRTQAGESPIMQALIDFLNASNAANARSVFMQQRESLDSAEAQQILQDAFSGGDPESQARIEERQALLRTLREEVQQG